MAESDRRFPGRGGGFGFSDRATHVLQVTGLFACYNRLADGLDLDPGW